MANMTKKKNTRSSKLPKGAKMVFKGKIFEVWQWRQKMFDGSFATFERVRRPDTATVVPIVGNKILMIEEEQPGKGHYFGFPGGRIDEGEGELAAAKRELLEETGMISKEWKLLFAEEPVNKMVWTIYTYVARDCAKIQKPMLDPGERIRTKLISFEQFLKLYKNRRFREGEMGRLILQAQYDKEYRNLLKRLLFGKK